MKNNFSRFIKNNKGLTLVEVSIAVGLSALALYMMSASQINLTKETKTLEAKIEDRTSQTIAERMLIYDLNNLDVIFNNITLKDDSGNEFFDYYSDIPSNLVPGTKTRKYTMNLGSGKKEIMFVTGDNSTGGSIVIDPVAAYDVGPTPADFNQAATLTFVSLNKDNIIKKSRPNLWRDGQIILLDTPAKLRPVAADGSIDLGIPGRSSSFAGVVSGQNVLQNSFILSLFKSNHPETGQALNTADLFLRTLGSMGGGLPLTRLHGVKVVKYYIEKMDKVDDPTQFRLMRTVYSNGKFGEPFMVLDGLTSIEFSRASVTQKLIAFKFVMPKKDYSKR